MDSETLAALRGSIMKWEKIAAGKESDHGPIDCHLCHLFYDYECRGCPVSIRVGRTKCERTPHVEYNREVLGRKPITPHEKALAQAEVDFLKSLLPGEDGAK